METSKKSAIIIGATGLTGNVLLQELLKDDRYGTVKLFSRSSVGISSPKLEEHLLNLFDIEAHKAKFIADEVFCCIGTTMSKTPNKEQYGAIDYGIPVTVAKLCKENSIETICVISALGANAESSVFYNRVKGEMEQAVLSMSIPNTYLLQPSLIGGKRKEKRLGEWLAKKFFIILRPLFVSSLKKYRVIPPQEIAQCMVILANRANKERRRILSDEISKIVEGDRNRT
ncbi:nucleoside-diphosphate sugar epimerase [Maribacter sp. CXY002]|uniref:nucleoside-diphosphate sugar epimerase n=1 Tax=Maribacter luteocoastalis TaxID=3407671 RepID=UPI003B6770E9